MQSRTIGESGVSKVVVITGAGVGLGRAIARRLARDGDHVVLLGRTAAKVEAAAAEIGGAALAVACDVSSPDSVRTAFATIAAAHPRIDVVVNNAAVFEPFLVAEATDEQILSGIGTNLVGAILVARSAIPLLGDGGHIINVSSESIGQRLPHLSIYQAGKAGLERFGTALAQELEPQGIRVTNVRAGKMKEEGKVWAVPPAAQIAFAQAAAAVGYDLRNEAISEFDSVTDAISAVVNLPADLHITDMLLSARKPRS